MYTYMEVSHDAGTLLEKGGQVAALVLLFLILLELWDGSYMLLNPHKTLYLCVYVDILSFIK